MDYTCDCPNCIKGGRTEPKQVSRSTYYSHAPAQHQAQITPIAQYLAQQGHSVLPGSNVPEPSEFGPPPKCARLQDKSLSPQPPSDNSGDGFEHRDGEIMDHLQGSQGGANDDEMDQSHDEFQGSQQGSSSTPEIIVPENVCIIVKYKLEIAIRYSTGLGWQQ